MTIIKRLTLSSWQQFAEIDIKFDNRLTIITGANGAGKTTILGLLAKHRGWPSTYTAVPSQDKKTGVISYLSRWFRGEDKSHDKKIGSITYSNGSVATLSLTSSNGATYDVGLGNQQLIQCLFVPSHRQIYRYELLGHIPTAKKTEQQAFDEVSGTLMQRYYGGATQSASYYMKAALVGWAIQGYGIHSPSKSIMPADASQREAYEGFQKILKQLLPKSLGFQELEIRNMEIVFICNEGQDEFLLETASGGVAAIIDMAWQLYMFSRAVSGLFTVIIDEAENHLHPSLQRALLPSLLAAFPDATFIVSTHSPLVVSSVKSAAVYVLRYNSDKKVVSERLDLKDKARNAAEILDEVLGVSSTLPIWVEHELEGILSDVTSGGLQADTFAKLRDRLQQSGLEHLMPEAISSAIDKSK